MTTTNGSTPPPDAWQVESMRVTVFPGEVVAVERASWWDDVVGSAPETVASRPKTGQYQAQGEFEGRRLTLQIQPGRIEWIISPAARSSEEPPEPFQGPFPEVLASLSKIVTPWLPQAPALTRFALGAVLVHPVRDVHTGYLLLNKYLPGVTIDVEGSSDFFYQINRPRLSNSGVEGLRVNRLTKWSVQLIQRMAVTLGPDGIAITRTMGQEAACRLELDINTAPNFVGTLPVDRLAALLQEMSELAREIVQRGDVK